MAGGRDQIFVEDSVDSYIKTCEDYRTQIAETYTNLQSSSEGLVGEHWQGESATAWLDFINGEVKDGFDKIDEYLDEMIKVVTDMKDLKIDTEHQIAGIPKS